MSKPPPPSDTEIERKTDSLRPGAEPERLAPEDVTGVIDLTLERLQVAQEATTNALEAATKRLHDETQRAIDLARRMSRPPDR